MKVTITTLTDIILTLDVSPDMELDNFKVLCECEAGIPSQEIVIMHEGLPLLDDKKDLKTYGIKEGDVLLLQQFLPQRLPLEGAQSTSQTGKEDDPEYIGEMLLGNPEHLSLLKQNNPKLAEALLSGNKEKFSKITKREIKVKADKEKKRIHMMNADPFDPEAQRLIAEEIRNSLCTCGLDSEYGVLRSAAFNSKPSYFSHLSSDDLVYKGHAATKIQAAYRGYKFRKEYWKEREQIRRDKDIHKIRRNYIHISHDAGHPSSTINVGEDYNVCILARNADPNLGLVPCMMPIDSGQKNFVLSELKKRTSFSDDIPTLNQMQDESGPCVLIMGGINPFAPKDYLLGGALFVYNPQKDKWFFIGTMPEPRNYHSAAYLHGKVYIIGGYSPFQSSNGEMVATPSTFQLTVRSKRWRKRADMHQSRACHGIVILDDSVLVIGGRDNTGMLLSTVELYDTTRDHWTLLKSLPEPLMGMGVCTLDKLIYVTGGIRNEGHSTRYAVSSRVYCFDPTGQSWFRKPSLPEPRAFCAATTLRREIWVWGGVRDILSEDGHLTSTGIVYVFNPEVAKWEQHFCMSTPKHAMAVAKAEQQLFIFGGISSNSKQALTENEIYDGRQNIIFHGAALPHPLAGFCAVGLPTDSLANSENRMNIKQLLEEIIQKLRSDAIVEEVYSKFKEELKLEVISRVVQKKPQLIAAVMFYTYSKCLKNPYTLKVISSVHHTVPGDIFKYSEVIRKSQKLVKWVTPADYLSTWYNNLKLTREEENFGKELALLTMKCSMYDKHTPISVAALCLKVAAKNLADQEMCIFLFGGISS